MLLLSLDDGFKALLDTEIDHLIAIVGEDDVNKILTDVMDIALDRGDQELAFTTGDGLTIRPDLLIHVRLQKSHG